MCFHAHMHIVMLIMYTLYFAFSVLQFFDYQFEVTSNGGRLVVNLSMHSTD